MLRTCFFLTTCFIVLTIHTATVFAVPQVYRDQVEPHWDKAGTRFWYRTNLSQGRREFTTVDAEKGTKAPAFDAAKVASQLKELLGRDVAPDSLPIDELQFLDDVMQRKLIGPDGAFIWNDQTGTLTKDAAATSSGALKLELPPRPSGSSSDDTELVIVNSLPFEVELFWVPADGDVRSYGRIAPGETHRQHTFATHSWLFRKSDGTNLGAAVAARGSNQWNLTQESVDTVQRSEGRRRGRRRQAPEAPENAASPDGKWRPFAKDNNLWVRSLEDQAETALTKDATPSNTFRRDAQRSRALGMEYDRSDFPDQIVEVQWSPDSQYLLAFQTTPVEERRVHLIESSPSDQLQPKLQSYPYQKPGDPIPQNTVRLFRMADKTEIPVSMDLMKNQWSLDFQRWSNDGRKCYLLFNQRGHQALRLLEVTLETGAVRAIIDETSKTFIHYSSEGKFELRWLPERQVLWASERSGWNHLYRYSLDSGEVLNAVTAGDWNVRRIEYIDEAKGQLWFYAVGAVPGQDPYHEHFCRVNLDGSGFVILTEGDGTHGITWSPDRRWFLDRYSRVDLPPVTELRDAEGKLVCALETADASELIQERGSLPERFVSKGRDGVTDIWGIIHRPKGFDPNRKYAVIENIYAGPHDHHVPKEFRAGWGHQHRIADEGFIVVQIDGMGTAWRSKAFHDVCWRNLRDAGFPDRVAWIKAASQKYSQMDTERVGIYGGSAGGQNAMAAVLWHGDFYKVAVADCGCHDNRMDKIWWNEQWMGVVEGDHYAQNSNMENAHLLQGKLMLVVGELDRNVDPATTMQVAKKLVAADKDFDLLIVPGAGHGACETPWASKRRTRFFVESLGGPK